MGSTTDLGGLRSLAAGAGGGVGCLGPPSSSSLSESNLDLVRLRPGRTIGWSASASDVAGCGAGRRAALFATTTSSSSEISTADAAAAAAFARLACRVKQDIGEESVSFRGGMAVGAPCGRNYVPHARATAARVRPQLSWPSWVMRPPSPAWPC